MCHFLLPIELVQFTAARSFCREFRNMDKIYKNYKKSGAYHRRLTKTREKYEKTLKNLYMETRSEVYERNQLTTESTLSSIQEYVEPRKQAFIHINSISFKIISP